jgi:hypothetical protein
VEVLRGIDDRLNRSMEKALGKWKFYPATRTLDVDVEVEIRFRPKRLAPTPQCTEFTAHNN